MPMVGGLVPLEVGVHIAARAASGLMRDAVLAGLVAAAADYAVRRRPSRRRLAFECMNEGGRSVGGCCVGERDGADS